MAWGKTQASAERRSIEFDLEGRTYQIEVDAPEVTPTYFAQIKTNSVSRETDLISGQEMLVVWSRIGVIRLL